MVLYQRVFIYNAISFDLLYPNSHHLLEKPYLFNFSLSEGLEITSSLIDLSCVFEKGVV